MFIKKDDFLTLKEANVLICDYLARIELKDFNFTARELEQIKATSKYLNDLIKSYKEEREQTNKKIKETIAERRKNNPEYARTKNKRI